MNRLQIVQKLARQADIGSEPSSTVSQTGEAKLLVEFVDDAYAEIENRHRWRWLRKSFTLATTASDDSYAYTDCTDVATSATISRFSEWRLSDSHDPPKIYHTSTGVGGERWLIYVPWNNFKMIYKIGSQNTNTGAPAHITVDPDNNILIGPSPNDIYTITGDYYMSSQVLDEDGDIPEMPAQYHNLIVYRAMEKYAFLQSAQELLESARKDGRRAMRQLENNQLPRMRLAGPMA
jgi:hypothetical protein